MTAWLTKLLILTASWLTILGFLAAEQTTGTPQTTRTYRGAILFLMPHQTAGNYIPFQTMVRLREGFLDLDYAKELVDMGFEVDYCLLKEVFNQTCDLSNYNVVALAAEPGAYGGGSTTVQWATDSSWQALWKIIKGHLDTGGGLLLSSKETNQLANQLGHIGGELAIEYPAEVIRELTPANQGRIPRFTHGGELAYSDNLASASQLAQVSGAGLTDGVTGVWYPLAQLYNNGLTAPLVTKGSDWVPLLRASTTAFAVPVGKTAYPAVPGAKARTTTPHSTGLQYSEQSPVIAAVRKYGSARVAAFSTWPLFHYGNGTKWQYDRVVLEKGALPFSGSPIRPSDLGRLLINTLEWLAQPTLASRHAFRTDRSKLSYPSLTDVVLDEKRWTAAAIDQDVNKFDQANSLYRGLIGLRSSSSGATIADYASEAASERAPVDFLVFLENYKDIKDRFEDYLGEIEKANNEHCPSQIECRVRVIPGYIIKHNLGGQMFFFGDLDKESMLPKEFVMNDVLILQQGCDDLRHCDPATYDPVKASALWSWTLKNFLKNIPGGGRQAGFARFSGPSVQDGLKIQDLRGYSAAAVLSYEQQSDGSLRLVEDATDQYLISAAGTLPGSPIAYAPITSLTALRKAVADHRGFTYTRAGGLKTVTRNLGWWDGTSPLHVVASDGPVVELWTRSSMVNTEAADDGIAGRSLAILPLRVAARDTSSRLKTVEIYDGDRLIRRYRPNSPKLDERLLLSGAVQHTLTVVVEDSDGRRAVVTPSMTQKVGNGHVLFLADRLNNGSRLWRGPRGGGVVMSMPGLVPAVGGFTWDGGPGSRTTQFDLSGPAKVETNRGQMTTAGMNQVPALLFADEGVVALQSYGSEVIESGLPLGAPTQTWGPKITAPLFYLTRSRIYVRPSERPELSFYTRFPERVGPAMVVFRSELFPGLDVGATQSGATLLRTGYKLEPGSMLIWKEGPSGRVRTEARTASQRKTIPIKNRGWFGVFSPSGDQSTQIVFNRGDGIQVEVRGGVITFVHPSSPQGPTKFSSDSRLSYELLTLAFHARESLTTKTAIARQIDYLRSRSAAKVTQGEVFQIGDGLYNVRAKDSAIAMKAAKRNGIVLALPVRVTGLNRTWSAGLLSLKGHHSSQRYGTAPRYRALALDEQGDAHFPLPAFITDHDVWAGHPVVASGADAEKLTIEVAQVRAPDVWAIEVHNPTGSDLAIQLQGNYPTGVLNGFSTQLFLKAGRSTHLWCESSCRVSAP